MSPTSTPLFDAERLRVYPRLTVIVYLIAGIALVVSATAMIDVFGKPLGYDFITFWAASHLTLSGDAVGAFEIGKILAAEQLAVPANDHVFLWHYPPVYQMLVAPLALMPYALSWFVFVGLGLALYVVTVKQLFDPVLAQGRDAIFLLLAFPGAFICVFHGQNSLYSAAIFVGGMLLLERGRPWMAGLLLGFLIYKPQLGVLLPIAFLVAGQWRALVATGASAAVIMGMATLLFGVDLWLTFLANAPVVRTVMEEGLLSWAKMPSAFIFLRELGVPQGLAYAAQIVTALGAAISVGIVWYRYGATRLTWAALVAGTLLVSPYSFDYEFAILAPVLVILGSDLAQRGASTWEKVALVALYALPMTVAPFVEVSHFQIGFLLLVGSLVFVMRRALSLSSTSPL